MQRKNNILSHSHNSSRKGMAMVMAISVIVIIGTIMSLSIALTSQASQRTTQLYLYEQSVLLSKSATEYALLRVAQSVPCAYSGESFTQDDFYDVNISVQYIYTAGVCGTQYATVTTPEQNGSILLDVTVSVDDESISTEPIRYFRRTIQKL
ncbi:MAG: hypothetical protein U9O86_07375 [Campylobacterota bacterium]|nr:hypothetical protein [Campylobacterota bacterium]